MASAEQFSEHPLGKAIVNCFKKEGKKLAKTDSFEMIPGQGVCAEVEGRVILAGNLKFLKEHDVEIPVFTDTKEYIKEGCTIIYVAMDNNFVGFLALVDDEIKELPHLVAMSKHMMLTIKKNMIFSITLNFIAILLAIMGILNPDVGALVHNAGSVFVIINSALLLKWKKK